MKRIPDLKELGKHCDISIIDEAHLAINAIEDILKNFHSTWYRYGLTATSISSARKSKWFHLTGQLGEKVITVTDKQSNKRVTDIDAFMFPFIGKSTSDEYSESYRPDVILNENRNKLISKMTAWAFKEKKVNNVLILVDEYKQSQAIKKFLKDQKIYSEIASSKISSEKLEDMKKRFCNKELNVIIATTTFSVGTNLPETECILLGSARKSNTNTLQKIGRGRRKITNKEILLLLDIYDKIGNKDRYFQKFSEKRLSLYKRKKWFREFINL
jgi:ATP-dependent helicase IRC3